jgi:hypothetical protein
MQSSADSPFTPAAIDLTGASFSGNGAASNTGAAVPTQGDYQGLNVSGTLRGQTGTNTAGSTFAADVNVAAGTLTAITNAVTVTDGAGALNVIVDSGTVVANAGTGTFTVAGGKTNNNAAPGATNVGAMTAVANAAAPTLTEGNLVMLSTDLSGALRVSGGGGGTQYAEDTAHVSGDALTLAGVVQQTSDAALSGNGDLTLLQVDESGFLKVNIKAGGGSIIGNEAAGTVGLTPPAQADYQGINVAGNLRGQTGTNTSGAIYAADVNVAAGTLTSITNPVTVTDGAGALNVIVDSGTVTANAGTGTFTMAGGKTNNSAAPGATNVGALVAVANVAAPTLTEGNLVALSTDLTGALRVSGGGGGTQYAEDTTHVSGDQLTFAGVVQQTGDTALAGNGDRTLMQVDENGFLKVNIKAGAGSGGTAANDNSAFTAGTTATTPAAGFYHATRDSVTDGRSAAVAINVNRAVITQLEDTAKNAITSTSDGGSKRGIDANLINIPDDAADNTTVATDPVPAGCVYQSSPTALTNNQVAYTLCDTGKRQVVVGAGTAGAPAGGVMSIQGAPGMLGITTYENSSFPILMDGLSTTVQTVAGSAATLTAYYCANPNTAAAYVQIFDISGTVTLGSSTPKWSIRIPPNDGAANLSMLGLAFVNAIKVAATTTATGSGVPTTPLDCNFAYR